MACGRQVEAKEYFEEGAIMEKKRIIKISKNNIFLTPEVSLSLADTSLRDADILSKTGHDIYLEVEVVAYKQDDN